MAGDLAPLVISAAGQQLRVELLEVPRLRDRHPAIAPEVAGLALDPALLVRFRRRAKVALEVPVRAERDEARGLFALLAAQDLLYCTLQVVISKQPKTAAKIMKRMLVGFEKRLLDIAVKN
jgi:hypothetical protein